MIHTSIDKIGFYRPLVPNAEKVFKALKELYESPFEAGRHPFDGDAVYVNAAEYDTKPLDASVLEVHRKYIDVMLLVEGEETIGVCGIPSAGKVIREYDDNIEAALYALPEKLSLEYMKKGDICILFPEDCHAPGMDIDGKHKVRKLIAKVLIDQGE